MTARRIVLACDDPIEATALQAGLGASLGVPVIIRSTTSLEAHDVAEAVVVVSASEAGGLPSTPVLEAVAVYVLVDTEPPDGIEVPDNVTFLRRPVLATELARTLRAGATIGASATGGHR